MAKLRGFRVMVDSGALSYTVMVECPDHDEHTRLFEARDGEPVGDLWGRVAAALTATQVFRFGRCNR